jgi:signal peptidase
MARYTRQILAGGTALILGLQAWWLLAPSAFGGKVSYVVVARGGSMEPGLHVGDLAITRRSSLYRVGDAVAYNSRDIGRVVLHRIIAVEAGRYVVKGDNNDFVDPFKPAQRDVVGKMWAHVPLAGKALTWLTVPLHAGAVTALMTFLAIGGTTGARSRPRFQPARGHVRQ